MPVIREKRDVSNFQEIHLKCYGDIILDQGERELLVIEADENILSRLSCEVVNGKLMIDLKSWRDHLQSQKYPVRFEITMKEVRGISIAGSAVVSADMIRADTLHLLVSGSVNGTINRLMAETLKMTIPGSCRLEIGGTVNTLEAHITGSARLKGEQLACQAAELRISGSAEADLAVAKTLTIGISGNGTVRYRGKPQISQRISGSGEIIALD